MASASILKLGAWNTVTDAFTFHAASPTGAVIDLNDSISWNIEDRTGKGGGLMWGEMRPTVLDVGNPRTTGRTVIRRTYDANRTIQVSLLWLGNTSGTAYATWIATLHNLVQTLEGITPTQPAALQFQPTGSSTTLYFDVLEGHLVMPTFQELLFAQQIMDEVTLELTCKPFLRGARQTLSNAVTNPGFEAPSGPGVVVFNDSLANFNAYVPQQYQAAVAADSPLRYYRLQEATGTTALDSGSAAQNGTYTGGVTLGQAGICGGASFGALFNGTSGYITAPTTGLPTGNSAFTLECWLNVAAIPGAVREIIALGTSATNEGVNLQLQTSGKVTVQFVGGSAVTAGSALTTSAWHQIACTWDGTTFTLYVDGASTGTPITPGAANIVAGACLVGANFATTTFLGGTFDEVAVYSTALSSARILAHYNAGAPTVLAQDTFQFPDAVGADSPLRYYRLDEASGTVAYDASGNAANGTTHGSPTQGVTGALAGDSDTAYTFAAASSQYISAAVTGLPTGNAAISLECWMKFASNPAGTQALIGYGAVAGANSQFIQLQLTSAGIMQANVGAGSVSSSALTTGAYHHVVATWDGTTLRLYVDGASVGTPATPGNQAIPTSSLAFNIAENVTGGSFYYSGQIDEVAVYGSALSAARVTAHYNAGHNSPTATANTMLLPAGARLMFGSPAWGAINTWQVRFRWLSSSAPTFYLHYTDANDYLAAAVTGTALTVNQVVGGSTHQLGTQALQLVNGRQYWLQVTQFPAQPTITSNASVQLFYDSNGSAGASVAAAVTATTFDGVTALVGRPQIASSGASLGMGGNFSSVHSLSLFGPGGWTMTESQNAVTGLVSGAWDGSMPQLGQSGTATNGTQTYGLGPVTSYGAGRMDLPPGGTVDALWQLYTGGGTPAALYPVPVQTATNVIGYSVYVKESGLAANATVAVFITEYNASGSSLRNSSNLGALTAGTLPTSWTQISGTYTTGANCTYVDIALRVVDTGTAAESANATVWWDNVQVWDQTRTGMTTMPYCEMRFPQSPTQVMVSGLLGDVPTPIQIEAGVYCSSFARGHTLTFTCARRAQVGAGAVLVAPNTVSGAASLLDTTSYGGFYASAAYWTSVMPTVADMAGVYHLLTRAWQNDASPASVSSRVVTDIYLHQTWGQVATDKVVETYSAYVYPYTSASVWLITDSGQCTVPPVPLPPQSNSSALYVLPAASVGGAGGGDTWRVNWGALLPVDAECFIATVNNASNALYDVTTQWLYCYIDALAVGSASAYSVEASAIPKASHAAGITGTQNTGAININPVSDVTPKVDPTLLTTNSGGLGVNQFVVIATSDSSASPLPSSLEITYSPLYLFPK